MTQEQLDGYLAVGKQITSYAAGIMTLLGVQTVLTPQDLITDVDHMIAGIKEFWLGAGPLVLLGMALWAKSKSKLSSKVASVQQAQPQALMQAVQAVAPVVLRDAVATQSEVKAILVKTEATAEASPSPKVTTGEVK